MITVKELKELLSEFDDDMFVLVDTGGDATATPLPLGVDYTTLGIDNRADGFKIKKSAAHNAVVLWSTTW